MAGECREAGGERGDSRPRRHRRGRRASGCSLPCLERFDRIDALVNNAGTSEVSSLEQLTDEDWQQQWELHVMAPMRLMRAAAPAMARRGWGRIVNVSSSSGKRPSKQNMAYSVTKAAELSLSRAFADQLRRATACRSTRSRPGPVGTELWLGPRRPRRSERAGARDQPRAGARGRRRQRAAGPAGDRGGDRRRDLFLCSERAVERGRRRVVGRRRYGAGDHLRAAAPMPVNTDRDRQDATQPTAYAVGREKIREYAAAVGETNPLHLDLEAARAAGYADVVAPPMFAVVYAARAVTPAMFDPEVGHRLRDDGPRQPGVPRGDRWCVAGDEITTTATVKDISERGGMALLRVRVGVREPATARRSAPGPGRTSCGERR